MSDVSHCKDVEFARRLIAQMKSGNGRRNSRMAEVTNLHINQPHDDPARIEGEILGIMIARNPQVCKVGEAVGRGHFSNLWTYEKGWPSEVRMSPPRLYMPVLYDANMEYEIIKADRFELRSFYFHNGREKHIYIRIE
jgi:hypothetical protein